jgi:glycosyltransferase involved in cell wall biosynthesis
MRLLLIHTEARFFAGAEKVLGHYLEGLRDAGVETAVACVENSRVAALIPPGVAKIEAPDNQQFSPRGLVLQAGALVAARKRFRFDLAHGWAARSWELTALTARFARVPGMATLHDHPLAPFISGQRRRLMRWSAMLGLQRIVCVSGALREACAGADYAERKLRVVWNGLPQSPEAPVVLRAEGPFRLGFLGAFSERKGLREMFASLDLLPGLTTRPWTIDVAGGAQDEAGRSYLAEVQRRFGSRPWWPQVRWVGWVEKPVDFLRSLDLLIVPSAAFDPLPTVLLEAGAAGIATLGARVGGVGEIIEDNVTGWLYSPDDYPAAAHILARAIDDPGLAATAGARAAQRVRAEFSLGAMVENYRRVYAELAPA